MQDGQDLRQDIRRNRRYRTETEFTGKRHAGFVRRSNKVLGLRQHKPRAPCGFYASACQRRATRLPRNQLHPNKSLQLLDCRR